GEEGAARGAALLALVGAGVYRDLGEALRATALPEREGPEPEEGIAGLLPGYEAWVNQLLTAYRGRG
ncbi:xylulokinase, partial [Thermus scotoductus]